jgi:hypothetical protein
MKVNWKAIRNQVTSIFGWVRGTIMVAGLSSATFADQLAPLVGTPTAAQRIRLIGCILAGLSVVLRAGEKNPTPEQIRSIANGPPTPPATGG